MGWRDRLESGVVRVGGAARDAADAGVLRGPREEFKGLRALFRDEDDQALGIERFLLALVRSVREDKLDEDRSARDVFESARRRRRRLGFVAFGAGPLVGVANQVADLYCDTATVCDLADVYGLDLADEQLAAHMLVLWSVTASLPEAQHAIDRKSVGLILRSRLRERTQGYGPENLSKRQAAKALWDARGAVGDARKSASSGAVGTVVFTGRHTKQLIKQAEAQLAVRAG